MAESVKISIAVIESRQGYVMQRRPAKPGIGAGGKIGLFGGKIEDTDANPRTAVAREVCEETGLDFDPLKYHYAGEVRVVADDGHGNEVDIRAQVYGLNIGAKLTEACVTDGELVVVPLGDISSLLDELTPATRAVFTELYQ